MEIKVHAITISPNPAAFFLYKPGNSFIIVVNVVHNVGQSETW